MHQNITVKALSHQTLSRVGGEAIVTGKLDSPSAQFTLQLTPPYLVCCLTEGDFKSVERGDKLLTLTVQNGNATVRVIREGDVAKTQAETKTTPDTVTDIAAGMDRATAESFRKLMGQEVGAIVKPRTFVVPETGDGAKGGVMFGDDTEEKMIAIRGIAEYRGLGLWLSGKLDWEIVEDSKGAKVLMAREKQA